MTNAQNIASFMDARTKTLSWFDKAEIKFYQALAKEEAIKMAEPAKLATTTVRQPQPQTANWPPQDRRKRKASAAGLTFASLLKRAITVTDDDSPDETADGSRVRTSVDLEFAHYLAEPPNDPDSSSDDVLKWRADRKHVYPPIYRVACVYLAVAATSVASERVLSTAGNVARHRDIK